jgi:hypothetical protein
MEPTTDEVPSDMTPSITYNYQYAPATYYNHQTDPTTHYNYQTEPTASSFDGHDDSTDVTPVKSSTCTIL